MFRKIILNKKYYSAYLIIFFLLIAAGLRFYNLNWDLGNYFHPDERNIANAVSKISFFSQLNPHFFAYGGFSIYLYRLAADLFFFITKNSSWILNWGNIDLISRFFSAFFSTITIVPLYFLTKNISDKKSAFLAIALYTFTVSSIQTAHYGVTESLITFIGTTVCLASILFLKESRLIYLLLLGIFSGIGIASKTSAIIFMIMPFFTFLLTTFERKKKFKKIVSEIGIYLLITLTIFIFFSPYTLLDLNKFLESMRYESGVVTGTLPVVYTLQFDHTLSYLFQIQNLFWQIGLANIFCLFGFGFILFMAIKKRQKKLLIFVVFPLVYFLYIGLWHTKFIRYMVPIIPFLIASCAIILINIKARFNRLGNLLIFITLFTTIVWALAFFQIYLTPQTRITASQWIYHNIPYDARILNEQWDDGLPIPIREFNPSQYKITSLAMYDQDGKDKLEYLANNLNNADYIILNSRRLYGTLIRLKDKYPLTSNYYKLLFEEKLGYKKIAEFTSYPSILGFDINDDLSEETFQVYDHPKVIIFKKSFNYNTDDLMQILNK